MTVNADEFLLSQEGNVEYRIDDVKFEKILFDRIRKLKLSATEVFALQNIEQRRIAYERMPKERMLELPDLKVLDEKTDGCGNKMRVISFTVEGFEKPFKFLHCVDPSTKREYYVETRQDACEKAKAKSFGLESVKWIKEW